MTRNRLFAIRPLAVLALAAAFSCSRGAVEETPSLDGDLVTISLDGSPEQPGSRMMMDFPTVTWNNEDKIAVFDGVAKRSFSIPSGKNYGSTAIFEGNVAAGTSSFGAVYPETAGSAYSGGTFTVSVPAVQTIQTGREIDGSALVCVAVSEGASLQFRQLASLLRFTIDSNDIAEVVLMGNSLAGKVKVNASGVLTEVTDATGVVRIQPSGLTFRPGTYYAAVLPGTTVAGQFSIALIRSDGSSGTRTGTTTLNLKRRGCTDIGTPEESVTWGGVIYTKAQLFRWNEGRPATDEDDAVSLGADIDMEMDEWVPRAFAGSFDGKGHKLYNLNVSTTGYAGLFTNLTGSAVVKDLIVGSSDGVNYDGHSSIVHGASATNYTWYYAGVVGKASGSSSVTGITNFATVIVDETAVSKTRIGGVTGNWSSTGTFSNNKNYGTIRNISPTTGQKDESTTTVVTSVVGGVVGIFDQQTTVVNCHNYGKVTTSNPGVSAVGGVFGYDGVGCTLKSCTNKGAVSHTGSDLLAETTIAGIIGKAGGTTSAIGTLSSCTNTGTVTASCNGKNVRIAGVSGHTDYYNVSSCNNSATIRFSNSSAVDGYVAIGGVVSHPYHGCIISNCTNTGTVTSDKPNVNRMGGIVANLNSSAVRKCTNKGNVTLNNSASSISNWQGVGGIVGFAEGSTDTREIENCVNEGAVTVTVNTIGHSSYHRCAAGGIIGMPYSSFSLSGNINRADVVIRNIHPTAPYAYAGGIVGQETGSSASSSFSTNLNYGTVRCTGGVSGYCGVGGLFGSISSATSISSNCNYGSVEGTVAGAVAGVNACTFGATVCNKITVNGDNYAAASNKNTWACPSSTGTITLTVAVHSDDEDGSLRKPGDPGNKVVAHRGGSAESGYPDNSRAGLRYAMGLKCYASECDIYWTSDNDVIIAHADEYDQINGLYPWKNTVAQIRAAGNLRNGETIPTLSEFIDIVMKDGSCTKLMLDIKMITYPSTSPSYPIKAAQRALEIIKAKGAQNFCEFICTSYESVMSQIASSMKSAGIPCGWMEGDISASSFKSRGYTDWANLCTRTHFKLGVSGTPDKGTGYRTITEFKNAGLKLSVFLLDKQEGSGNAVYTEENVMLYLNEYSYLRCVCSNYPSWLKKKIANL